MLLAMSVTDIASSQEVSQRMRVFVTGASGWIGSAVVPELIAAGYAVVGLARSSIVRLDPTCHGEGDHGFMAALVGIARQKGVSGYIGDGTNRWPAVHRLDSAHLFCLALEKAQAGSTLHAVADEGVPIRSIA